MKRHLNMCGQTYYMVQGTSTNGHRTDVIIHWRRTGETTWIWQAHLCSSEWDSLMAYGVGDIIKYFILFIYTLWPWWNSGKAVEENTKLCSERKMATTLCCSSIKDRTKRISLINMVMSVFSMLPTKLWSTTCLPFWKQWRPALDSIR